MTDANEKNNGTLIILALVCLFLAIVVVVGGFMLHKRSVEKDNWQKRWNDDTKQLQNELKDVKRTLSEEVFEKEKIKQGFNKIKEGVKDAIDDVSDGSK